MASEKPKKHRIILPFALLISGIGNAGAAERWAVIDGLSMAELPAPSRSETISGARLVCEEKRWQLELSLMPDTLGEDGERQAEVSIGAEKFSREAVRQNLIVSIDISSEMLPPLRAGSRMDVSLTGGPADHRARFSLAGSRVAIDTIAPLCSNPDMSAYRLVSPSEFSPETVLARELLDDEIKAFRAATKSTPTVAAAMQAVGEGRRLLFATICGSSWYYGNSGCNMTVHAQEGENSWQRVYETEGVTMHIDPDARSNGWPDLVALTFDGDKVVWKWMEGAYQPPIEEELRGG